MKQKKRSLLRTIVCIVLVVLMLGGLIATALSTMVRAATSAEIKSQLNALRQEQNELKKQSDALKAQIDENKSKTQTLIEKKADIDQQIRLTTESITNLNLQLQQYSLLIADKQHELEDSEAEEARLNAQYKTRLRSMEESGKISYWAILFGAKSFSDLLDKVDAIREIAEADQLMLKKLAEVSARIESERVELEEQMAELDAAKAELAEAMDELDAQRADADVLLVEMAQAYEQMTKEYADYMDAEDALGAQIAKSEKEYNEALSKEEAARRAEQARLANERAKQQAAQSGGAAPSSSGFLYPLPYTCQITDSYGYRTHPLTGKYSWHNGVDFAAPAGTTILATKSGTVTTAAYAEAWGYYIVINHGDGFSSLYAHQPYLILSVGDFVTQGQTIGYVGSTGWSTGPHLHFSIFYNGSDVNPFNYIG